MLASVQSNSKMAEILKLLDITPISCLEMKDEEVKPLYLEKVRLSGTHELTLQFSDDLLPLPMNFVRDYIVDTVLDLRARSAIDYEEVVQGTNVNSNATIS